LTINLSKTTTGKLVSNAGITNPSKPETYLVQLCAAKVCDGTVGIIKSTIALPSPKDKYKLLGIHGNGFEETRKRNFSKWII
jgi:hypothetical protein